ncbi:MAG TPA: circadian clock protein KaiC [Dermatophilaceae bacterium]|nr:circadian clock protein KaiC [Dermatophilaceae bacterium]
MVTSNDVHDSGDRPGLELPKSPTGITGFDEVSKGGLPTGRPTLVSGPPGSGKTLFALQFLVHGATRCAEPGVYLSFEGNRTKLASDVRGLGIDLDALEQEGHLLVDAQSLARQAVETGEFDLEALMVRMTYAVQKIGAKRVAIDSLESLFAAFSSRPALVRSELLRLFSWLEDQGLTAVITGERAEDTLIRHGMEEFLSDCVVLLDHRVVDEVATRRLRILKYRGSTHGRNEYPFLIGPNGLEVLPITSIGLNQQVSSDRLSTGIAGLDEMLGGQGVFRASSVLVSGTSGTGKTTIAASFASAACQRGERVLFFSFEESQSEILRNMASVSLDLAGWIERGLLHFYCERPTTLGLEGHLATMQRLVEQVAPTLVVIDPVSSLSRGTSMTDVSAMLMRQIYYLKVAGITAVMTSLTEGGSDLEHTEVNISSLVDTWMLTITMQSSGERNRGLYVLKSRGMAHSNQIREFLLSSEGVSLVPVYMGPDGVLTGSARAAAEAVETGVGLGAEQESTQLFEAMELRRKAVETRVASLWADLEAEESLAARRITETKKREDALRAARLEQGRQRTVKPEDEP